MHQNLAILCGCGGDLYAPCKSLRDWQGTTYAISLRSKSTSEGRYSRRLQRTKLIPAVEFPAVPESARTVSNATLGGRHLSVLNLKFDFISDGGRTREKQIALSLKRHLFPHGSRESKAFWICFSRVHPPSEIKSNFKFKTGLAPRIFFIFRPFSKGGG